MVHQTSLLQGKRGLIMGVANERSIAWGIAQALHAHGAELVFTYQNEVLEKRVRPLAESLGSSIILPCDVSDETSVASMATNLASAMDGIDFLVHAIAFSDKNELTGQYVNTTKNNFLMTMDISCYSFTTVTRHLLPLLRPGASLLTLTYHGAQKVMPHYNVMGVAKAALEASVRYLAVDLGGQNIRVNAISAGPIRTLAASGIGDFRYILKWSEYNAPLKRNTTIEEVGGAAAYLISDLSSGTTGEILYVDSGYHVVGMKAIDAPDIALHKE